MKHSEQFLKKRRFFTVVPLMIYPFLCLIFWCLGGASGKSTVDTKIVEAGLNTKLPDANVKTGNDDVLSLYDQAARDSAKLKELREIEARNFGFDTSRSPLGGTHDPMFGADYPTYCYEAGRTISTEDKVNQRLTALQQQLEQASTPRPRRSDPFDSMMGGPSNNNLARMQQIMQSSELASQNDPELESINGMLDKIMKIQNPQLMENELKEQSAKERGKVFTLDSELPKPVLTMTANASTPKDSVKRNRFFSVNSQPAGRRPGHNAIKAMVYAGGEFASNSTIQLMLEEDLYLNGNHIPKGSFVYGKGEVSNERLQVRVTSIGVGQSVFKVDMSVYDLDAQEGISAPGAITRNEAKEGAANALQSMNIGMLDPSIGAQAAGAGIQTAKSLITKTTKMVYANINAGHHVLLIDNKQLE